MSLKKGQAKSEGRQRGVKASPSKLHGALLEAGFTSQSQVALKIQQQENLPSIPRSMVSRVFRGESVDPLSIERVAKALNVPAWQLYLNANEDNLAEEHKLNADEQQLVVTDAVFNKVSPFNIARKPLPIILLISTAIVLIIALVMQRDNASDLPDLNQNSISQPSSKLSLMINFNDETLLPLVEALHEALSSQLNLANIPINERSKNMLSVDIAREYQSDGVLTLRNSSHKRFQRFEILLYLNGVESLLFDLVITATDLSQQRSHLVGLLINHIYRYIEGDIRQIALTTDAMKARDHYLAARMLIDQRDLKRDEDKINNLLRSAIDLDPNLAVAYGAMCQSLLLQSWLQDEKTQLQQAGEYCHQATQLSATNTYIQSMNAELLVLTGETNKAIDQFQLILNDWPQNIDALNGLGRAYIEAFNLQLNDVIDPLIKGEEVLKLAVQVDPNYWHHHEALGGLYFIKGQTALSLTHFKQSAQMSGNLVALTNVGVLSLCQGKLDQAQSLFEQVQVSAPHSHLGDEYLGLLAFYRHDFARSLEMNNAALSKLGQDQGANIHQYWGYLGDAYRWLENKEKTIHAYQQALNKLQQYKLRGVNGIWEEVAEMYYQLHIDGMSKKTMELSPSQRARVETLLKADAALGVKIKLAQLLLIDGKQELARALWQSASERCLVYQTHPDFVQAI